MNASWKPQVKKPNTSRTYERCANASLSALVSDCAGGVLDPALPEAFGGVARASANGTMSSSMLPKVSSAFCQPKLSISATQTGANRNWPTDPAAVPAPIAIPRYRSGKSLPNAAITRLNEQPERPKPTSTPAVICRVNGEVV